MAIVCLLLAAACASTDTANSDTVKQSEIFQSYSVTYDAGDNELSANAGFRFGGSTGTTLLLVSPASVKFDGEAMSVENSMFSGTFYELFRQEEFRGHYIFVFTDGDGKAYTNSASLTPAEITGFPAEINPMQGALITFSPPLSDKERIYCYIEDSKQNNAGVSSETVGSTSVEFSPDNLKTLQPGDATIHLIREKSSSLAEATHLGGKMHGKYISAKKPARISENTNRGEGQKSTEKENAPN